MDRLSISDIGFMLKSSVDFIGIHRCEDIESLNLSDWLRVILVEMVSGSGVKLRGVANKFFCLKREFDLCVILGQVKFN